MNVKWHEETNYNNELNGYELKYENGMILAATIFLWLWVIKLNDELGCKDSSMSVDLVNESVVEIAGF
jgi:hypothetical protein